MEASPAPRPLLLGGRYCIQRKLGSGSMGTVYLARDESAKRQVALKLLDAPRLGSGVIARLQEEFRALAGLHHPQIAAAYDFGYEEGRIPFLAREYVEGTPLEAGPPRSEADADPREFLKPFFDLLDALHYVHVHEILHLDIHAGNLIVASDARRGSVLIDFGSLGPLHLADSSRLVSLRSSVAPELLLESPPAPLGPATDLYAVGRLLLYRLTGRAEGEPSLPREVPGWGSRLTLLLERIAEKALQSEPQERFQTAAQFREALWRAVGGSQKALRRLEPGERTTGRGPQIRLIEEALRRSAAGKAAALWLAGPPGLGKTRLLTEARLRAQLQGLKTVEVRFVPDPASEPLLRKALGSGRRGQRSLPSWLKPLTLEHGGSTRERARRAAEAYFIEGGPPLALLLDDLEEADAESRILAEALVSRSAELEERDVDGRGLAMIVTSSDPPGPEVILPARRRVVSCLRPLAPREASSLLQAFLRPLELSRAQSVKLARLARGVPLHLRQIARALHAEFGPRGLVPQGAEVSPTLLAAARAVPVPEASRDPLRREALQALAILGRPASVEEIETATGLRRGDLEKALRWLVREEVLTASPRGGERLFHLVHPQAAKEFSQGVSPAQARQVHDRMVQLLRRQEGADPRRLENLTRHLLAAGRQGQARALALRAQKALRGAGRLHSAVGLLEETALGERNPRWRLRLAEEISFLHEQAGDHQDGIAVLLPIYRGSLGPIGEPEAVRIRRRLGVHYHRAGDAENARRLFEEVKSIAKGRRYHEETVFVESELAELHTLRGEYPQAEAACRRGLDLLALSRRTPLGFRGRMEAMLRASLAHLELRRMELTRATRQLEKAFRLARVHGTTAMQALILNHLGIAYNQGNRFERARRSYRRAERLLLSSGEGRGLVQVACNLATLAAKTGDPVDARNRLEQAAQLLHHYPGKRLELFVLFSRGMASHSLGDMAGSREAFLQAIPLGKSLGDEQLLHHAALSLAETQAVSGHLREALRLLSWTTRRAREAAPPVLGRMVHSRRLLLETLLGRWRAADASRRALEATPRTEVKLLEAWNDLIRGLAAHLAGEAGKPAAESAEKLWEGVRQAFRELGLSAGERLAQVGLLYLSLSRGDHSRARLLLADLDTGARGSHRILDALLPLARAEAHLSLGELDRVESELRKAAAAMVGLPFLELDARIEFLHARLVDRRGDREGARRYLHRTLHTLELITGSLLPGLKKSFLNHPRFNAVHRFAERMERPRSAERSTPLAKEESFHGMVGRSPAMVQVWKSIEQIRDQEITVLITGQTGTGKELVARAIHQSGPRKGGLFLALHCGSLPTELFESELFGHAAGAFTGAEEARLGLLDHLAGGTLLLDEVSSLPLVLQTKLLRVLTPEGGPRHPDAAPRALIFPSTFP